MNFVAIDFETADYSRDSACSVGLVKFNGEKVTDTFYSLIRPPSLYVIPNFTDIHGLAAEDLKDAPVFRDLWESKILPFVCGLPLAAHNAAFDMGVLRAVLDSYGLAIPELSYFCTCSLARHAWPELKSHALTALARHFGISYNAHNALDDAETCGRMVLLAAEELGGKKSLKGLLKAAGLYLAGFE